MKRLLLFTLLFQTTITYSQELNTQTPISRNTFYLEFLGTGGLYSVNFDRILYKKNSFGIAGRTGITYWPKIEEWTDVEGPGLSIEVTGLLGKKRGVFEFGTGLSYFYFLGDMENNSFILIVPRIGYRNQQPDGGFFYRIGFTPWIPIIPNATEELKEDNKDIVPMIGLSIGYTIKN
jgi:hypothetical protein